MKIILQKADNFKESNKIIEINSFEINNNSISYFAKSNETIIIKYSDTEEQFLITDIQSKINFDNSSESLIIIQDTDLIPLGGSGGGGGTLQEVTDAGSTTTNNIIANGFLINHDAPNYNYLAVDSSSFEYYTNNGFDGIYSIANNTGMFSNGGSFFFETGKPQIKINSSTLGKSNKISLEENKVSFVRQKTSVVPASNNTYDNYNFVLPTEGLVGVTNNYNYTLLKTNGNLVVAGTTAPSSATAAGVTGELRIPNDGYLYVCVAANTWVRTTLSTW